MSWNWYTGNAAGDGRETRGWILGHFLDPSQGVRSSKDVEVKWGIHPAGEKRHEWTADDQRTTLVLMVEGNFKIDLTEASITLERQGDYAVWGPGIDHSWEAITNSIVVTVRWPSSVRLTRGKEPLSITLIREILQALVPGILVLPVVGGADRNILLRQCDNSSDCLTMVVCPILAKVQ